LSKVFNNVNSESNKTIELTEKVLRNLGLNIKIINETRTDDLCYSCCIEIVELNGIIANGKGISKKNAYASALGEMIERIQSGLSITKLFDKKNHNKLKLHKNCNSQIMNELYKKNYLNLTYREKFYIDEYMSKMKTNEYHCVNDKKTYKLPESFIVFMCGSNGVAAGTSYEYAISNSLCENFERYVLKIIYNSNYKNNYFKRINENEMNNSVIANMLEIIRRMGFLPIIIDCTLNNKYPVIGVLLFSKNKKKYIFSIGADINFYKCLTNCITELFQGIPIKYFLEIKMKDFFDVCNKNGFWKNASNSDRLLMQNTKSGILPREFFKNISIKTKIPENFIEKVTTEKERLKILFEIVKDEKVFITNYTLTKMKTVRVFIPHMSEAYWMDLDKVVKFSRCINGIKNIRSKSQFNSLRTLEKLIELSEYKTYRSSLSLKNIDCFLINNEKDYHKELTILISYIALHLEEYEVAKMYLLKSTYLKDYDVFIYEAIEAGVSENELNKYIDNIGFNNAIKKRIEYLYKIKQNGVKYPFCFDCKNCDTKKYCLYEDVIKIKNLLQKNKENHSLSEIVDILNIST